MEALVTDKESAHRAAGYAYREAQDIIARGKRAVIKANEYEDDRSLQQNRFYFGVVLKAISEQASVNRQRYTTEAWHIYCREQFLGYVFESILLPGRKRKTTKKVLRSTTDLTVKQFAEYVEKITAHATTDLGVRFPEEQRA